MLIATSILIFENNFDEIAQRELAAFEGVEVHAVSDDQRQVVICIERESLKEVEALDESLRKISGVIDIAHHAVNFEEEVL